jgi:signal transduction histidine kinase
VHDQSIVDGGWTLASQVAWQFVAWPLVVLLTIWAVRRRDGRRAQMPAIAVCVLLVSHALSVVSVQDSAASSAWFLALTAPWFIAFPVLCATYPDGRFVPRWLLWPTLAYGLITVIDVVRGGALRDLDWWWMVAASQVLMVFGQVYRYRRRATTPERESVRWAILGIVLEVEAFALVMIAEGGTVGEGGDLLRAAANVAALPIPVALAVGLVRPSLARVDVALRAVIGATIAGGALAGAYAATTAVAGAAEADATGAGWWGAAAVAVLAVPVVRAAAWTSAWVVYRGRCDPDQAVARLGAQFDAQPDAAAVPETVLRTVVECAFLDAAALRGDGVLSASLGDVGPDAEEFPLVYQGEEVATLLVPPRRGESELTWRDREVISRLAVHAAPALHGARALAELTEAHSRLLHAREEERKELRRDLHDDLSPTLAGLALGAAAVSRRAVGVDAKLAAMAEDLHRDIHAAVAQTREIAYGLRPPVLDDQGLVAAIRSRVHGHQADHLHVEVHAPNEPLALPAAVDLAALRIVQEAVTNVRKHACAIRCTVTLDKSDDALHVTVVDDGVGPPARVRPGLGLASIRERATELGGTARFTRAPGGGGLVTVRLPVREVAG